MATTDTLNVKLTADTGGFTSKIKQAEKATESFGKAAKNSEDDIEKLGKATKEASEQTKKFGEASQKAADKAESAFTGLKYALATLGLGNIIKESLSSAMNAVESESLFEVSLGDYANKARAWSEEMSSALGLDGYALRKNLGTLYNMTTSMGLTKDKAYELSTGLTALAEDMASFYNLSSEEAFAKLRSGITGEAEPLKAIGILLNETAVEQAAYRHGIAETGTVLTDQQKVLARYAAILGQTANAQGDLARTMDSPANQLRATMNDLKQVSIEFGMALMPIVQTALPILRDVIEDIKPVAIDVATGVSYLASDLTLLENPATRTIIYTAAVVGVMNKLKLAVGGPLTAVILLGTALSWLAGKFGEVENTEKSTLSEIAQFSLESKNATDEAQKGAEELGKEYKNTGNEIKGMLAGFDEITKLSGGSASIVTDADVQNAADINKELSNADDIIDSIYDKMNGLFEGDFSIDASINLLDVDWNTVMTNFKDWMSKQDWRKAWQDMGTGFTEAFRTGLSIIDGLFGTKFEEWYGECYDFFFDFGTKLQIAANPADEGLKALEKYEAEHGSSAWTDFYNLYKGGMSPKEAFNQVYSTPNLKKGFLAANADLATYYVKEWAGLSKTELAKLLEDNPHAEDMVAQSLRINDKSFMGIDGGLKSWVYNSFVDYKPQDINVMEGFDTMRLKEPVKPDSSIRFPVSVKDTELPATASDVYSIMQSLVPSSSFVGPIQINTSVELDGEKVGAIMTTYNHDQISITNGKQ
ncbi:MAG: hypothetical protein IKK53_02365 [Ruminiclostridium sp.]|nr:hypothetical protein [Ruminiclostridium sp.]